MKATKKHPISKFRKGTLGKPKPSSGEGKLCAILLAERHTHLNGKSLNWANSNLDSLLSITSSYSSSGIEKLTWNAAAVFFFFFPKRSLCWFANTCEYGVVHGVIYEVPLTTFILETTCESNISFFFSLPDGSIELKLTITLLHNQGFFGLFLHYVSVKLLVTNFVS